MSFDPSLGGSTQDAACGDRQQRQLQPTPEPCPGRALHQQRRPPVPRRGYLTLDGQRHKALADQLTTAARDRLRSRIASLTQEDVLAVGRAIKIQLALTGS